jgi:hypothetical protein
MKKIEPKNLKKRDTTLTDHQTIKLDEQIRESKSGKRYKSTSPTCTVTAINNLAEVVGGVYDELKQLNHLLSDYLYTDRKYEENEK